MQSRNFDDTSFHTGQSCCKRNQDQVMFRVEEIEDLLTIGNVQDENDESLESCNASDAFLDYVNNSLSSLDFNLDRPPASAVEKNWYLPYLLQYNFLKGWGVKNSDF